MDSSPTPPHPLFFYGYHGLKRSLVTLLLVMVMRSSCHDIKMVDLTYQLRHAHSITWPYYPDFNFSIVIRGMSPLYHTWVEGNTFEMPEHMGTHLDAPSHIRTSEGGWRMHQIPPEKFMGPGVVLDVRDKVDKNHQYKVTAQDLQNWESHHGKIPDKAIVLVNTGWGSRYPDKNRVFGTDNIFNFTSFKFPSMSEGAARWLAESRTINAFGMDTPSPDTGVDHRMVVHEVLLLKDILVVENVANLDRLTPTGYTIVLGALNIHDGSGAPMRMLAFSGGCRVGLQQTFHGSMSFLLGAVLIGVATSFSLVAGNGV